MRSFGFAYTAQTFLNSSGAGTASVGPLSFGEYWDVAAVSVRCATNANEATCSIYAGADSSSRNFVDATTWGSTGDSTSNVGNQVRVGNQVFAVWTGGDVGTQAYVTVSGTRYVS